MLSFFKSPPPLTTPEAVRDAIFDRLEKTKRVTAIAPVGEDQMGIDVTADGKVHKFFLENAIVAVLQSGESPRGQHRTLRNYVSAFISSLDEPPINLDRVYPIVRHRDYVVMDGVAAIHTPVLADLVCAPALDTPQTLVTLTQDAVEDADLALAEVWGAARVNLSTVLKDVQDEDLGSGLHIMRLGEPWMGTSLMLAPDLFQTARTELEAEVLYMAAPSREGVVYIDSAAPNAFELIKKSVEIGMGQDHPQSAFIFTMGPDDEEPVPGWRFENGAFHAVT